MSSRLVRHFLGASILLLGVTPQVLGSGSDPAQNGSGQTGDDSNCSKHATTSNPASASGRTPLSHEQIMQNILATSGKRTELELKYGKMRHSKTADAITFSPRQILNSLLPRVNQMGSLELSNGLFSMGQQLTRGIFIDPAPTLQEVDPLLQRFIQLAKTDQTQLSDLSKFLYFFTSSNYDLAQLDSILDSVLDVMLPRLIRDPNLLAKTLASVLYSLANLKKFDRPDVFSAILERRDANLIISEASTVLDPNDSSPRATQIRIQTHYFALTYLLAQALAPEKIKNIVKPLRTCAEADLRNPALMAESAHALAKITKWTRGRVQVQQIPELVFSFIGGNAILLPEYQVVMVNTPDPMTRLVLTKLEAYAFYMPDYRIITYSSEHGRTIYQDFDFKFQKLTTPDK